MHCPQHFKVDDQEAINTVVRNNPFCVLISVDNNSLSANHIPLELEGDAKNGGILRGHLARNNAQLADFSAVGNECLTIFTGPHSYVSPTWYVNPGVPTWNFMAVHCYGHVELLKTGEEAIHQLERLVKRYEGNSWSIDLLPSEQREKALAGIVSFKMVIDRVEAKFKLSQNKTLPDRQNVFSTLSTSEDTGSRLTAEAMARYTTLI